jgi:hypothetical protein
MLHAKRFHSSSAILCPANKLKNVSKNKGAVFKSEHASFTFTSAEIYYEFPTLGDEETAASEVRSSQHTINECQSANRRAHGVLPFSGKLA